jgi:hypothetical protein
MSKSLLDTKVLIVVMTYPHPSQGYQEVVCTAAITESGEWVRLYPIDYRYLPVHQKFKKFQWIKVQLAARGQGNDSRKESRKPDLETITLIGEPLSTKNDWAERREIIDSMPCHTLNQLKCLFDTDQTSLGIVRPTRVIDLEIRPATEPDWKPEWQQLFSQKRLFGEQQKLLRKLPYSFHYIFECEDSEKPHVAMCEDWELGALFLKESDRLGSDEAAAQSVRTKFLDEICRPDKDTRFFMGTYFPYNTWLVLGLFWPPRLKDSQKRLF